MKLYAWQPESYGLLSFFVMAEDEEEARAAVRKHIAEQAQGEFAREYGRNDWPNNHELKVLERGQVVENGNG